MPRRRGTRVPSWNEILIKFAQLDEKRAQRQAEENRTPKYTVPLPLGSRFACLTTEPDTSVYWQVKAEDWDDLDSELSEDSDGHQLTREPDTSVSWQVKVEDWDDLDSEFSQDSDGRQLTRKPPPQTDATACLPPEVLVRIFEFLQPVAIVPWIDCLDPESSLGWAKVTHVCRRWRLVALECAGLWANVILYAGLKVAEECSARAAEYPLTVELRHVQDTRLLPHGRSTLADSSIAFIRKHASRIHALRIFDLHSHFMELQSGEPCEDILSILAIPAPEQSLLLDMSQLRSYYLQVPDTDGRARLWQSTYPRLRRLVLVGIRWEPAWHLFPRSSPELRHLTVALVPGIPITSSPGDIFRVLRQLASLQSLHLAHCLPICPETCPEQATFPRLESLILHGPVLPCSSIFQRLNIPLSARIDIRCVLPRRPWVHEASKSAFNEASSVVSSFQRYARARTVQFIMKAESAEVLIGEGESTFPSLSTDSTAEHEAATKFVLEGKSWQRYCLLETVVCAMLPSVDITALSIATARELNGNPQPHVWPQFLATCENLTELRLLGTDTTVRVCEALAGNFEQGWGAHAPVMLPCLDTLALCSVNLKRWWCTRTHVRAFISERRVKGAPLRVLRVVGCLGARQLVLEADLGVDTSISVDS
ncbi:hypothetical protein FA95DRAFT_1683619 [Auriscalpium vulgare]|uniref:Uncharacterized protein n=1 Tax=Auriscalpium vulgare TaxID=40419 RepID=A0ACB8RB62_9AGAM|nr:hypothetical protein FA95DRAFT_1683619 [Auriscalpium vulgare]